MELDKLASLFDSVKVGQVQPGDFVVFRLGEKVSLEERARITAFLELSLGAVRVLVLDPGADIALLRPDTTPEPAAEKEYPPGYRPIKPRG